MITADALTIERRGRVAILSFNRPRVLNAFDGPLVEATTKAMAELSADENVLAIVVRGEGRAFSAGFDLKAGAATAGQRTLSDWRRMLEADFAFIMAFWECPKPTIAAIHGYCIGGAVELSNRAILAPRRQLPAYPSENGHPADLGRFGALSMRSVETITTSENDPLWA